MYKITMRSTDLKVLRAFTAGKREKREMLRAVHLTADYIEATDGRALFRLPRGMIATYAPDGVYMITPGGRLSAASGMSEAILDPVPADAPPYPDTDRVIPPASTAAADLARIALTGEDMDTTRAVITLYRHTGNAYEYALLDRLSPLEEAWTASKAAADAPVRLESLAGAIAVICSFKVDNPS